MKNRQDLDAKVINIALHNPDNEVAEKIITAQANFYESGLDFQPYRWMLTDEFFQKIAEIIQRKDRASINASVLKLYDQWRKRKDDEDKEREEAEANEYKSVTIRVTLKLHKNEEIDDVIRHIENKVEESFECEDVRAEED